MRIVTNDAKVRRQSRLSKIWVAIGFAGFAVAFILLNFSGGLSDTKNDPTALIVGVYVFAVFAYVGTSYGQRLMKLWSRKPTPLQAIVAVLRNSNKRNVLFNYVPNSPADHVLLTHGGVFLLISKHIDGKIIGEGSKWKHSPRSRLASILSPFSQVPLGRPFEDVKLAESKALKIVSETLGEAQAQTVPVIGAIVFTEPGLLINIENPAVPALDPDAIRGFMAQHGEGRLTAEQMAKLTEAFAGGLEVREEERRTAKQLKTAR